MTRLITLFWSATGQGRTGLPLSRETGRRGTIDTLGE